MLAGIIFQLGECTSNGMIVRSLNTHAVYLVALVVFMLLMAEYFYRFLNNRPFGGRVSNSSVSTLYVNSAWTTKLKLVSAALSFTTLCLLIR